MTKKIIPLMLLFGLILAGCNFPGATEIPTQQQGNAVLTAAAETVETALTQVSSTGVVDIVATVDPGQTRETDVPNPTVTPMPLATITPLPTNTPLPTDTTLPCNMAAFVKDVTVPDNTEFEPEETFTKTWRLKNVGTCPWTSKYDLIFDDGDVMGGDTESQVTNGKVSPGQSVDVSIELTAPATVGTYRGDWRLQDANNVIFGLTTGKSFWVQIKVVEPPDIEQVTLYSIGSESGYVLENGTVKMGLVHVGDRNSNNGSQAFISFNISGIPSDATIIEVTINFSDYDKLGTPFGSLNCLHAYAHNYETLGPEDYKDPGAANSLMRWCNTNELNAGTVEEDLKDRLQSELIGSRLQLRLQFKDKHDDGDNNADLIRFSKYNMMLIVKYTSP